MLGFRVLGFQVLTFRVTKCIDRSVTTVDAVVVAAVVTLVMIMGMVRVTVCLLCNRLLAGLLLRNLKKASKMTKLHSLLYPKNVVGQPKFLTATQLGINYPCSLCLSVLINPSVLTSLTASQDLGMKHSKHRCLSLRVRIQRDFTGNPKQKTQRI